MITEFKSTWAGHPGGINVSNDRVYLIGEEIKPVPSGSNGAWLIVSPISMAELDWMLAKKGYHLANTSSAAPMLFALKKKDHFGSASIIEI